jgi:hypothetical protein
MQRWNDDVLLMSAPVAGQYLRNPVQLAGFGVPATEVTPVAQVVTRAVTPPAPAPVQSLSAPVVRAAYRAAPAAAPAGIVSAAYRPAPARPAAPPALTITTEPLVPAAPIAAPQDLLLDGQQ